MSRGSCAPPGRSLPRTAERELCLDRIRTGTANLETAQGALGQERLAYTTKIEYNMDDDGNRTSVVTTPYGSSPTTVNYTDNSLNQYTAVGGTSRSHDGNGNVSDDGTYLYEYNYKNLICRVKLKSNSSTVGEYRYDALGRRVEKVVTGATYRYVYSGVETVGVYTTTGTWKQDYVYGPGIDEVLMLEQADVLDADGDSNTSETARSWYLRNALGSVMEVLEQDKSEAVSYRYDPYGNVTITRGGSSQSSDPLGQYVTYTGRWHDGETGLYYYRARVYDSARGRFKQEDPLLQQDGSNLFEYVHSSPACARDPSGTIVEVCYRSIDKDAGPPIAKHAYLKVSQTGKRPVYYGLFQDGLSQNPAANEGRDKQEQTCRKPKRRVSATITLITGETKFGLTVPTVVTVEFGSFTKIPCNKITDAQIEECLDTVYKEYKPKYSQRYSCGDFACEMLNMCCLECDEVPLTSRLSIFGGIVNDGRGPSPGCRDKKAP